MRLDRASTLPEVALAVGAHLKRRGIRAVLTGGACVAIYTKTYVSKDADFVLQGRVTQRVLDDALGELGFERRGDRYVHPDTAYFLEFPPGPLSIGDDLDVLPVQLSPAGALALSATDSCRDRLAAFYHWNDRQALQLAVEIAQKQTVDLDLVGRWSTNEGMSAKFEEFTSALSAGPGKRSRRRRSSVTKT